MNQKKSGLSQEIKASRTFHQDGIVLLVSPQLLRARDLGQLDLARLKKDTEGWILEVGEVKSSETGEFALLRVQGQRLKGAQNFLSRLFGSRTRLIRIVG